MRPKSRAAPNDPPYRLGFHPARREPRRRMVGAIALVPAEAEVDIRNFAAHDDGANGYAFDCRTMTADKLCEYVGAIPDDGERIAPTDTFCGRGSRFVGFDLFEHRDGPTLVTVWFATAIDPDDDNGVRRRDGSIVPALEIFTADGDIAITDPSPAFMEVSKAEWSAFEHVVVSEAAPGQHQEFHGICLDMWQAFLASARAGS